MFHLRKIIKNTSKGFVRKYKILNITVFKKEFGTSITIWVVGIPIAKFKNRRHPSNMKSDPKIFVAALEKSMRKVLWIDHSLGGGTEIYTLNSFREKPSTIFIRCQYNAEYKKFLLTTHNTPQNEKLAFSKIKELLPILKRLNLDQIVVNNVVGYPRSIEILQFVAKYKKIQKGNVHVSFRGHDFHAICPSFTLLNSDNKYCQLKNLAICEQCLAKKRFAESDRDNEVLRSGATTIAEWRAAWNIFFSDALDNFIVFSYEIAKIFFRVYPQLEGKTVVIPHKTTNYHTIDIKPHKKINIAFLGNIDLEVKGSQVIDRMIKIIDKYEDVNLKIIGNSKKRGNKVCVTGSYKPQDLPYLMKREQIDIVFIASVAPETFSYTTSEAMSMGIPVACFNFGAPYERVRNYPKGLVLESMNEISILDHIVDFVMQMRRKVDNI